MRRRVSYKLFFKIILSICVALIYLQFQLLSSADRNRLVQSLGLRDKEYIPKRIDWRRTCFDSEYENSDLQDEFEANRTGYLNVLLWENLFGSSVNSFLTQPLFPKQPSQFLTASNTYVKLDKPHYGQWIIGYLRVDITGEYRFALSSDDSSEFWISTDERPENVERVAQVGDGFAPGWTSLGQHAKYLNQVSDPIPLEKCKKYFIQVVHKQAVGDGFVAVSWNRPGTQGFYIITKAYLLPLLRMPTHLSKRFPPVSKELESLNEAFKMQRKNKQSLEPPAEHIDVQRLDPKITHSATGICGLQSQAPRNLTARITQGEHQSITQVYPQSWTYKIDPNHGISKDDKLLKDLQGKRDIMPRESAKAVVRKFMAHMEDTNPGKFTLESINTVEHKKSRDLRDRYLLDLTLKDNVRQMKLRSATYVYKNWEDDSLCVPEELQWMDDILVQVIVVVTTAEHEKWAISLIDNVDDIYQRTEKGKIQLTVVHYGPRLLDVEGSLLASSLPRRRFLYRSDAFSYAKAVQEGVNAIEHDESILLLVDPHVKLPFDIFDQTRKHCFQGKMAFNPIAFHLVPGRSPGEPEGLWDPTGVAVLGMHKGDWRRLLQDATSQPDDKGNWNIFANRVESFIEVEKMKLQGLFLMNEDEELMLVDERPKNGINHQVIAS